MALNARVQGSREGGPRSVRQPPETRALKRPGGRPKSKINPRYPAGKVQS